MKQLLILTSRVSPKLQKFVKRIEEELPGKDVSIIARSIDEVWMKLGQGVAEVYFDETHAIGEASLVLFRGIKKEHFTLATSIALVLEHRKIPFQDSVYAQLGASRHKLASMTQLALRGSPIPETLFFAAHSFGVDSSKRFAFAKKLFGTPFVAKKTNSHRGAGLFLVHTAEEFKDILEGQSRDGVFLFQKFIERKCEYRLLTLKDYVAVAEEKIPKSGEWRANVALGADEKFLDVTEVRPDIIKLAIEAAQFASYEMSGVDILIEHGTEKPYVLEVNRGPGLTYDRAVHSPEFKAIADYIHSELGL